MRHDNVPSRGPGDAPPTAPPVLSIGIGRELATVVVTLEGVLDEDSSPALAELLWDLVVGQGNLSVTVDAHRLSLSDPALNWVFRVVEREAALRGGSLAVVEPQPERSRLAASLDQRRACRAAALAKAAHPAGAARARQSNWIGGGSSTPG
jgi:anti-anti-sigma regulatory factor